MLLLFSIISIAGAVLFAAALRQEGGRWWAAAPLVILLLLLVVFGPLDRSSGVSLLSIALLAPAVLVLLLAFPLRQGSLAWFGAVESGFISLIGLLWAYGLFIAPPLAANVRTDSPARPMSMSGSRCSASCSSHSPFAAGAARREATQNPTRVIRGNHKTAGCRIDRRSRQNSFIIKH